MVKYKSYEDKNNNKKWLWTGFVGINPMTNKKLITSARGFDTKKKAKEDFIKRQYELQNTVIKDNNCTLEQLFNSFIKYKEDKVKSNTLRHYKNIFKGLEDKRIINLDKKIKSFSVAYCQNIYTEIKKQFNTPRNYFLPLKTIFNYAIKMELIESNPFSKVDTTARQKPKQKDKKKHFELDELKRFIKASKTLDNSMYYYIFLLLSQSGMRQGEARALTWRDINFKDKTININKTITKDINDKDIIGDTPKTESSNRIIYIDDNLLNALKEWKIEQSKIRVMLGVSLNNDLVFHNNNFNILSDNSIKHQMKKVCKLANVEYITLHGLRHTFISIAIESGLQPIDIAHTVGHSDINMIMKVYDSMTKNRRNTVANVFSQYVGNL